MDLDAINFFKRSKSEPRLEKNCPYLFCMSAQRSTAVSPVYVSSFSDPMEDPLESFPDREEQADPVGDGA